MASCLESSVLLLMRTSYVIMLEFKVNMANIPQVPVPGPTVRHRIP